MSNAAAWSHVVCKVIEENALLISKNMNCHNYNFLPPCNSDHTLKPSVANICRVTKRTSGTAPWN